MRFDSFPNKIAPTWRVSGKKKSPDYTAANAALQSAAFSTDKTPSGRGLDMYPKPLYIPDLIYDGVHHLDWFLCMSYFETHSGASIDDAIEHAQWCAEKAPNHNDSYRRLTASKARKKSSS